VTLTPQALLPLPATPVSLIVQQEISSLLGYYEVLIERRNDQLYEVNFTSGSNGQVRCCMASAQLESCWPWPLFATGQAGQSIIYKAATQLI
jgi:hypothetical protein